jgi:hypothetical protein
VGKTDTQKVDESKLELTIENLDSRSAVIRGSTVHTAEGLFKLRDNSGRRINGDVLWAGYDNDGELNIILKPEDQKDIFKYIGRALAGRLSQEFAEALQKGTPVCYMKQADIFFLADGNVLKTFNGANGRLIRERKISEDRITAVSANSRNVYCGTNMGEMYKIGLEDKKAQKDSPYTGFKQGELDFGSDGRLRAEVKRIKATDNDVLFLSRGLCIADTDLTFRHRIYFPSISDFEDIGGLIVVAVNQTPEKILAYSRKEFAHGDYAEYAHDKTFHERPAVVDQSHVEWDNCYKLDGFWLEGRPFVRALWKGGHSSKWSLVYDLSSDSFTKESGNLRDLLDRAVIVNKDD